MTVAKVTALHLEPKAAVNRVVLIDVSCELHYVQRSYDLSENEDKGTRTQSEVQCTYTTCMYQPITKWAAQTFLVAKHTS